MDDDGDTVQRCNNGDNDAGFEYTFTYNVYMNDEARRIHVVLIVITKCLVRVIVASRCVCVCECDGL